MNRGTLNNKSISWSARRLTLGVVRRVQEASGINLARPDAPPPGRPQPLGVELMLDPLLAAEVAYHIASPDLGETTLEEFLEAADLARAEAFGAEIVEDLADFFAVSGRPEMIGFINGCMRTREMTLAMARGMETLGNSSPSSQGSQGSSLGDSHSASSHEPHEPGSEPSGADSPA